MNEIVTNDKGIPQPKRKRGRPRKRPLEAHETVKPVANEQVVAQEDRKPELAPEPKAPKKAERAASVTIPPHYWQNIQGWCKFHLFYGEMVARAGQEATFVEVGCWKGQSAAYMGVEILNSGKDIAFHCVDHFQGSDEDAHKNDPEVRNLKAVFEENMKPCVQAGLDLTVHTSDSEKAASKFKDGSIDFVWLDAGHDYHTVKRDIVAWLPKVKAGGIIGGDDYPMKGVGDAVREVLGVEVNISEYDGWKYWHMPVEAD
jgi:predicted O-methyltransferase YrrM